MNRRQAKEILLLYRPWTADKDDPEIAEALSLAQRDGELGQWFEKHCAVQEALRAKFGQIAVPEGLKEQILSERKAHTTLKFQRRAVLLAVAAAAVVAFIGVAYSVLRPHQDNSFSNFRNRMAGTVLRGYPNMDMYTNDLVAIHKFLAEKGHGDYTLPAPLARTAGTGCKILNWHGEPVTMVCFNSGHNAKPGVPDLFLFVVNRSGIQHAPSADPPRIEPFNRRLTTASWSSGAKTYVLGGLGDEDFIKRYF